MHGRHCLGSGSLHKRISLKYTFNNKQGLISLQHQAFTELVHSQNSPFSIQCVLTAVVLAAAGRSGDKSGKVSLGNGLQKGSGS